jgi:biopolymer transport protein ExbD
VTQDDLVMKMKAAVAKDSEVRAIISADQSLNYGKVMGLIDLVKEAGIAKFALNIQKEVKAAAVTP